MKTRTPFLLAGVITIAAVAILFLSGYPEGYCFFWPSIDTEYAEAFSEENFAKLQVGMPRADAEEIMCSPLGAYTNKSGLIQVFYTSDGAAPFGDFAWFGRGIEVSNSVITRVVKITYYD